MLLVLVLATVSFSYEGTLRPGQTLAVHDINGSVRVRSGDRLAIHATKSARRGDPNQIAIRVDERADGLVVCVRYPPNADRRCDERGETSVNNSNDNDTTVDFEITLPRGVALDAKTVNGSVDAQTDGTIDAGAVNGTVRVEGRDVRRARTVNGSVDVRVRDSVASPLDAKSVNGSITVALPAGSGFTLSARTLTGGISADGIPVERPRYGPGAKATGTMGDGARHVTLETVNGSITVTR